MALVNCLRLSGLKSKNNIQYPSNQCNWGNFKYYTSEYRKFKFIVHGGSFIKIAENIKGTKYTHTKMTSRSTFKQDLHTQLKGKSRYRKYLLWFTVNLSLSEFDDSRPEKLRKIYMTESAAVNSITTNNKYCIPHYERKL